MILPIFHQLPRLRSLALLMLLQPWLLLAQHQRIPQHRVAEWTFYSTRSYEHPFQEIELDAVFTDEAGREQRVPAFWDGGDRWKIRFSAPDTGRYAFYTICSDPDNQGLHKQKGSLNVRPTRSSHPLYGHGAVGLNARAQLVQADGTPFPWLADSWWHGMTTRFRWPEDFQQLTQDRKAKGFSVIQFAIAFPCDLLPFDSRGANEAGFATSQDYQHIRPAYFQHTDQRVLHLLDQGLMPNILGSWGYYLPWFGVDNMKRYWRYLIARYGAYPISWTLAGETTLIYYLTEDDQRARMKQFQRTGWSEVAAYIQATDPFDRLLTAHPGPASGQFQAIDDMSQLDLVMVQPGHGGWDSFPNALAHLQTAQEKFPERPVMQGEVCFEGMHGGGSDAKLQRLLFWTNMLSGAAGHCYGVDGIWQFNTEEERFGLSPGGYAWGHAPWEEAQHWKGSFYVGLGRKLLERYPWQAFEPARGWISSAAGPDNHYGAYGVGMGDSLRLVYFPKGVMPWGQAYELSALNPEAHYQVTFVDPRTGQRHLVPELVHGHRAWRVPAAPILQDWLLEVVKLPEAPTSAHPHPVNPNASAEARELLKFLYANKGKMTFSGQHNYPGTISRYTEEAFELTGRYPAIWGQDFGFTETGKDGIDSREAVIQEAIRRHEQGFIITLMWHAVRPIDDEPNGWKESVQNDLTDAQWKDLVTSGTALHQRWLAQLDVVAEHLKVLREAKVPVLWRPYHEMNGRWFWWGDQKGPNGYQALWRHMYDRFVNHHQLNNLLWVWNANALVNPNIGDYHHYFPGLDVVDILATDVYGGRYDLLNHTRLLAMAEGKPIALGECGQLPTPEILEQQPYWSWFMCWAGFLTRSNQVTDIKKLYESEHVRHRKDLIQWPPR